jgi:prevent-host-death family protein
MSKRIDVSDLYQRSEEIVSRVCETRERYVIEQSGTPVAAVVSIDDLARLEESLTPPKQSIAEKLASLERARAVREMILRERHGKPLPDSAKTIRALRAQRGRRFLKKPKHAKANLR